MTAPKRIRRLRQRGWRKPENAVIVARTSRYGTPWRVGDPGVPDRQTAVARFAAALEARRAGAVVPELARLPADEDIAAALRGRDLACPCPLPGPGEPDHCHARVLMDLAAGGKGRG